MKVFRILIIIFVLMNANFAISADENIEPKQNYTLVIDGHSIDIELDNEIVIKKNFSNPKVKLIASAIKTFETDELKFEYPSYFTWKILEEKDLYKQWILAGNSAKIMYLRMAENYPIDKYIEGLINQYGENNCKVEKATSTLNGKEYIGNYLYIKTAGIQLRQTIFDISTKKNSRYFIIVDRINSTDFSKNESDIIFSLLNKSLLLKN